MGQLKVKARERDGLNIMFRRDEGYVRKNKSVGGRAARYSRQEKIYRGSEGHTSHVSVGC